MSRPLDWPSLFGRSGPLVVELGFGDGTHLARSAREAPEEDFVGIEARWKRCQRALHLVTASRIANVRILHADGRTALERVFPERSIARFTALFPTPWVRRRQASRRFFSADTLALLNSRLQDRGRVRVVSDDAAHIAWIAEQVPAGFACEIGPGDRGVDTHYARRSVQSGSGALTNLELVKVAHLERRNVEESDMRSHLLDDFDPSRFAPLDEHGSVTVVFLDFVFDPVRRRGLQHALVFDDGFKQDAWIALTHQSLGWRIHQVRQVSTVPTPGLQRALDLVADAVARSTRPRGDEGADGERLRLMPEDGSL